MLNLFGIFNGINEVLCLKRHSTPLVGMVAIIKYGSHCLSEVCKLVMFSCYKWLFVCLFFLLLTTIHYLQIENNEGENTS